MEKPEEKKKQTYDDFKSKILHISDYQMVIDEARKENDVTAKYIPPEYTHNDIPLNLEREYIDELLELKDFNTAQKVLDRMKKSYEGDMVHNILEAYEYRLNLIRKMDQLFKEESSRLKQELNQHNITTISIIAGVITIFGVAGQTIAAKSFTEGIWTFLVIAISIILLTLISFLVNKWFYNRN